MKFVVAQVKPELCKTKNDFIAAIDRKVAAIKKDYDDADLIIFPESLGLWMCMMSSTSWINKIFNRFLHPHSANSVRMSEATLELKDMSDELIVNLQFAKPLEMSNYVNSSSISGLLDNIPVYQDIDEVKCLSVPKKDFSLKITNIANWIFSKLPLRFIAQYLRSKEMMSAYMDAFSQAAIKYNVNIQAGSLFERVVNGTLNVAYIFNSDGEVICRQEKWHPIPFEGMLGVKNGSNYEICTIKGVKCGIAICADVNMPNDLVSVLAKEGCKFIAVPSGGIVPTHLWDFNYERDVATAHEARAKESKVTIGRSYNAGDLLGGLLKFQGRSTIVDENGLVEIVPDENLITEYNLYNKV